MHGGVNKWQFNTVQCDRPSLWQPLSFDLIQIDDKNDAGSRYRVRRKNADPAGFDMAADRLWTARGKSPIARRYLDAVVRNEDSPISHQFQRERRFSAARCTKYQDSGRTNGHTTGVQKFRI